MYHVTSYVPVLRLISAGPFPMIRCHQLSLPFSLSLSLSLSLSPSLPLSLPLSPSLSLSLYQSVRQTSLLLVCLWQGQCHKFLAWYVLCKVIIPNRVCSFCFFSFPRNTERVYIVAVCLYNVYSSSNGCAIKLLIVPSQSFINYKAL